LWKASFAITQEFNGSKGVTKYKGRVDGDTLRLHSEWEAGGETRKREIEAKREKTGGYGAGPWVSPRPGVPFGCLLRTWHAGGSRDRRPGW
jgi:hypothetical protein